MPYDEYAPVIHVTEPNLGQVVDVVSPQANEGTPLLHKRRPQRLSSTLKTFGNIVVSTIGAGVLGLPYAFKRSGWLLGTIAIMAAGGQAYYSMMLLVKSARMLNAAGGNVHSYGDLGHAAYGTVGREVVDALVLISQGGFATAYLVFVSTNVATLLPPLSKAAVMGVLLPLQIVVSWIRSLTSLAPFALIADSFMMVAVAVVIRDDVANFHGYQDVVRFTSWTNVPFVVGVAVYCFEGFAMTQPLEASMKERSNFGSVLGFALFLITMLYSSFGLAGYFAYGDETCDIITLNLPQDWSTVAVKLGLSVALFFTFPVMMVPVYEIAERRMTSLGCWHHVVDPSPRLRQTLFRLLRAVLVVLSSYVAVSVPGFGVFISLVGSSVCAMLAFVLPSLFHLKINGREVGIFQAALDVFLIIFGILFGIVGTWNTLREMVEHAIGL